MDERAARRILGVGPDASVRQARDAYQRRAKLVHPDRHAHATPSAQREAQRAMSELNEAWRTIKHGRPAVARSDYQAPRPEPARPVGCEICGHLPAIRVDIRSLTGLLILHRMDRYAGTLCRACGTALCRDTQAQTLTLGWWGMLAPLVNLAVLINNGSYLRALREIDWPRERPDAAEAPLLRPMPVTPKVAARVMPWIATITAVMAVLAILLGLFLLTRASGR